jgi:protoporphyrinogen/coproporphyrinogen III oxidase
VDVSDTNPDVVVVGAGVAGLTAAYRLRQAGRSVRVLEATERVGGRMRTYHRDGFVVDEGTETLAEHGYPETWRLVRELGIDVLRVKSAVGVWRDGRAHGWFGHPMSGLTGAGLRLSGRVGMTRMAGRILGHAGKYDVLRPGDSPLGTMTVAELGAAYGDDLARYLLQPAVGTAFGWTPERSAAAPMLASLLATRGIWKWQSYAGGMERLPHRLAEEVPVELGRPVAEVKQGSTGAHVVLADGETIEAGAAVLAVPGPLAAELHPSAPDDERPFLTAATFAPMLRVTVLLDEPLEPKRGPFAPHIYALLVPAAEDDTLGGLTIEHNKVRDRAPAGKGLVSLLPATRLTRELLDRPDEEVGRLLLERAERYLPGIGAACRHVEVHTFAYGLPEATPAAVGLAGAFLDRPARRVDYAGDWVHQRPTSESAVASGAAAAERVLSVL